MRKLRCFPLLLFLSLTSAAQAETLYQRSCALFSQAAAKASPQSYTFVVLGDSRGNDAVFKKALRTAAAFHPLFILHGGDYSDSGSEGETRNFLSLLQSGAAGTPVFVVPGNHEDAKVFETLIGPPRFRLESLRLGLRLVVLDDSKKVLRSADLDYLKNELAQAPRTTFVAMHVPPQTPRWRRHTFTEGASELEATLATSDAVQASFFAHSHLYDRDLFAGKPAFISGGAGAMLDWTNRYGRSVYHILVVTVEKGWASYRMVPLK